MKPLLSLRDCMAIAVGGSAGSLLRWWLGWDSAELFPLATLWINLAGTSLLALLHVSQHRLHPQGRYLYMVGFCGSFTTVSLFARETIQLVDSGHFGLACLNIIIPVGSALLAVALVLGPLEKRLQRSRS